MTRRLRAVPEHRAPILIDPPDPDTLSDEWCDGWQACREVLAEEWEAWYQRGLEARPCTPRFNLDPLALAFAFILGMVIAAAAFLQAHG